MMNEYQLRAYIIDMERRLCTPVSEIFHIRHELRELVKGWGIESKFIGIENETKDIPETPNGSENESE